MSLRRSLVIVEDSYQTALAAAVAKGQLSTEDAASVCQHADQLMVEASASIGKELA
ncbi:hypothetical protein [uncultured Agrobacterium sp.]|uniref:hypothetical protein n=1 Tax=uncultured Agrobacterium sp. TaxID=157277 RepID=UPI0025ED052B|nr:hypothetical protein [uncultured Agrobacterium sp.]